MTEKLFLKDSYVQEFHADIINITEENQLYKIELNRTYFYPEGGGQPSDNGFIDSSEIFDVQYENNHIIHFSKSKPSNLKNVVCKINWDNRFDLMQQHTGQHILSAAFEKLFEANTVGFHLSNDYVTIDLDKRLTMVQVISAENLSNEIIYNNLAVKTHYPNEKELDEMPLRKPPKVTADIRITEVTGFDFSPCGGTHVNFTGEIGIIKIKKIENHKDGIRVEFISGSRALKDYQFKNELIYKLAIDLSVKPDEVEISYEKMKFEMTALKSEIKDLKEQLIDFKIQELVQQAQSLNHVKIITHLFTDIDMSSMKRISASIVSQANFITLFALVTDDVKLLFAKSADVDYNMKELIQKPLILISGRGGGNQSAAQGGGPNIDGAKSALQTAFEHLNSLLS
ncbi:MAG: alanyl-tRNA editing protein AlaX-L [Clostridiales bacterium]|nr:alanyl-tRNA editing protein AlaX-L [Clostridiales bacterium]